MHQLRTMIVGLFALLGLVGCQAPSAVAPLASVPVTATTLAPAADEQAVEARVDWGYHVATVVSGYTKADVDHLKLSLFVKSGANWVATGATKTVAASALASPVSLGNLKMATSYRVLADAYADAAETKLISTATSSQTDFTTAGLTTTAGVASVNDATQAIAAKVTLADKTYAGTASVDVTVNSNVRLKIESLIVTLYQVSGSTATQVYQKDVNFNIFSANPTYTLTNLKAGTSYRLIAVAYDDSKRQQLSNDGKSTLNFTVPSLTSGQLDDNVNNQLGDLNLPCMK